MSSRNQLRKFAAEQPTDDAVRASAHEHQPQLVVSRQLHGEGILDHVADFVSALIGSMYLFVAVSLGVVFWLFAGNVVGFDKTPWPLLLTILNLPQLSIMISLQVAANRAQTASDARALADHKTLIALNEMNKRQLQILEDQNRILALLQSRAMAT